MYKKTTDNVTVSVESAFSSDHSEPDDGKFVWLYHVAIENNRQTPVTLCKRYWRIIDEHGKAEEVSGAGVIGQQPIIEAGKTFEYVSGAPLRTPSGIMEGYYSMLDADGNIFTVDIPAFSLDSPFSNLQVN